MGDAEEDYAAAFEHRKREIEEKRRAAEETPKVMVDPCEDLSTDSSDEEPSPRSPSRVIRDLLATQYTGENLKIVMDKLKGRVKDLFHPDKKNSIILEILSAGYQKQNSLISEKEEIGEMLPSVVPLLVP